MQKKHICFVVPNYPTQSDPVYTFVRELVCSIAELGYPCSVIAPQSVTKKLLKNKSARPQFWQDFVNEEVWVDVYQPRVLSFSNLKIFGTNLSAHVSQKAVIRVFRKIRQRPDIIYAHFWHSGVTAGLISKMYKIPFFVATGESKIWVESLFPRKTIQKALADISGVICVSTKNLDESIELKLAPRNKMIVIPNAVDPKKFYKMDKREIRSKLGFGQDDFIVSFMGSFDQRKGVLRLAEAVKQVEQTKVIFIGSGNLRPTGEEIVFLGKLPHNQISEYLNCSDVFVLPTLAEGCSNAILEAMACGLPIISSDLSFNDDILTDRWAIRVDSMDVTAIAKAIRSLKNDDIWCKKMAANALEQSQEYHIDIRAKKIVRFINNSINDEKEVQNDNQEIN
ncbi:glycosyltransferase family 4 protein [Acetobacterium sp. UBA5834]|jgi:glycosyltransferase involved in cell wall biosynthesis|uniref:glycosyltransferase family 4 protein n=1 Tax=Acetobacterium sp. UBA5834 TaxID=1945907 RepID=UPI00257A8B2D|nr:glycosyltransferase family 4 protein [Acetobacterium sp. UBA5834]